MTRPTRRLCGAALALIAPLAVVTPAQQTDPPTVLVLDFVGSGVGQASLDSASAAMRRALAAEHGAIVVKPSEQHPLLQHQNDAFLADFGRRHRASWTVAGTVSPGYGEVVAGVRIVRAEDGASRQVVGTCPGTARQLVELVERALAPAVATKIRNAERLKIRNAERPDRPAIPPLRGDKVRSELFYGALTTVVAEAAAVGMVVGAVGLGMENEDGLAGVLLVGGLLVGIGGPTYGNARVVWAVGSAGDEEGSFASTFAGAVIGTAFGAGAIFASNAEGPKGAIPNIAIALLTPAIGATIGFNLTRRWDLSQPDEFAVATVQGGTLRFGVPRVAVRPSLLSGAPVQMVDLVRVRF